MSVYTCGKSGRCRGAADCMPVSSYQFIPSVMCLFAIGAMCIVLYSSSLLLPVLLLYAVCCCHCVTALSISSLYTLSAFLSFHEIAVKWCHFPDALQLGYLLRVLDLYANATTWFGVIFGVCGILNPNDVTFLLSMYQATGSWFKTVKTCMKV